VNLRDRLAVQYGPGCFDGISPELSLETEMRSAALWAHIARDLDADPLTDMPARSRTETISTPRAFPHTRRTSRAVSVVFDLQLIDLFGRMTEPMVMASWPSTVADAHVAALLWDRLTLAGCHKEASALASLYAAAMAEYQRSLRLSPAGINKAELLIRGQWLFVLAHELVHVILDRQALAERMDRELSAVQPHLMAGLATFAGQGAEDPLRREIIRQFVTLIYGLDEDPYGSVKALMAMARERLNEPRFRHEVICDWLAARVTAEEMAAWAPRPIGLACCGLSLIQLAAMKQMDAFTQGFSREGRDDLGEGALRLIILLSILHVRPPAGLTDGYLLSRAFGDITIAYLDTYGAALRIDWASLIAQASRL
jgi:hypothetical protein